MDASQGTKTDARGWRGVPHYYFHLYDSVGAPDFEGRELPDLDAARAHALHSARGLVCEQIQEGHLDEDDRIEVVDEQGRTMLTLRFGDSFEVRSRERP